MTIDLLIERLTEMSSNTPASLDDFVYAVDKLDPSGANWIIWQSRFTIAVKHKGVYGQFDGSNPKPVLTDQGSTTYAKELAAWAEKDNLALYLLSQKLPDRIFFCEAYAQTNRVRNVVGAG